MTSFDLDAIFIRSSQKELTAPAQSGTEADGRISSDIRRAAAW
jgi:hypothetical protein